MADLKVRNLDDRVAAILRIRAKRHGVSLEEEDRRVLSSSVVLRRTAVLRRAAALRGAIGLPSGDSSLDSVRIIREERDAWGLTNRLLPYSTPRLRFAGLCQNLAAMRLRL